MTTNQTQTVAAGRRGFIYAAIIIGSLAIALDFASVDLALPALEHQFGLDLETVQWVINGYVLAFAVLMVTGGRLADGYGRKRIFLIGMGIFALASLLGGAAWSGDSVIAFRVFQGVGAAMLWPAMIGMACGVLGDDKCALALGLIFGSCSVGNAAGPVLGGALTQYLSWRWVLWVNVPMAVFAMFVTLWKVPWDRTEGTRPRNDYAGMGLLTFGLVALMLFIYQSDDWGLRDFRTIGLAAATVGLLGMFPFHERRTREPLVPPDIMRNREIQTLCLCTMVICQLFFIVLLYITQYRMKFLGEDPVQAGMCVVQFMLTYGVISYFGGPLCKWFGSRQLILIGLVSATAASVLLGWIGPGSGWLPFNGSMVLLGIGVGAVIPTISVRAIEVVGTRKASLVSGITFLCQLAGAAAMLAINTVIFEAVSTSRSNQLFVDQQVTLTSAQETAVDAVLRGPGSIHEIPAALAKEAGDAADLVERAYGDGLQVVLWFSAALVFVALLLVLRFVPRKSQPMLPASTLATAAG
jgi:EmrB/QacA subfamily drug resistance transporter